MKMAIKQIIRLVFALAVSNLNRTIKCLMIILIYSKGKNLLTIDIASRRTNSYKRHLIQLLELLKFSKVSVFLTGVTIKMITSEHKHYCLALLTKPMGIGISLYNVFFITF